MTINDLLSSRRPGDPVDQVHPSNVVSGLSLVLDRLIAVRGGVWTGSDDRAAEGLVMKRNLAAHQWNKLRADQHKAVMLGPWLVLQFREQQYGAVEGYPERAALPVCEQVVHRSAFACSHGAR